MVNPRDLISNLSTRKKLTRVQPPTLQELISPPGRPEPMTAAHKEGTRVQAHLASIQFKHDNAVHEARLAAEAKVVKAAEDALLARVLAR
jgi:hypothetical protein